jgi:hypothetical protein
MTHVISPFDHSLFLEGPAAAGKTTTALAYLLAQTKNGLLHSNILILLPESSPTPPSLLNWVQRGSHVFTFEGFVRAAIALVQSAPGHYEESFRLLDHGLNRHLLEQFIDSHNYSSLLAQSKQNRALLIRRLSRLDYQMSANGDITNTATAVMHLIFASKDEHFFADVKNLLLSYRDWLRAQQYLSPAMQIDWFNQRVLDTPAFKTYIQTTFEVLLADNIERLGKVAHDLLFWFLEYLPTSLLILDHDGDGRDTWGANPDNALLLKDVCQNRSLLSPPEAVEQRIVNIQTLFKASSSDAASISTQTHSKKPFFRVVEAPSTAAMARQCVDVVRELYTNSSEHAHIAIITPAKWSLLSHDISFLLGQHALKPARLDISISLTEDPFSTAIITLLKLVSLPPNSIALQEITSGLQQILVGLDPLRACLLALHWQHSSTTTRTDTRRIQSRIDEAIIDAYTRLVDCLHAFPNTTTLSQFLAHLFDTVLRRPGFTLYDNLPLQKRAQYLLEYAQILEAERSDIRAATSAYLAFAAGSSTTWVNDEQVLPENTVLLCTVQDFLRSGRTVDYQIWLDAGHRAWTKQIEQVLFSPQIVQATSVPQVQQMAEQLHVDYFYKRISVLIRRCRRHIIPMFCGTDQVGIPEAPDIAQIVHKLERSS